MTGVVTTGEQAGLPLCTGSFRDPSGQLFVNHGRVLRTVNRSAAEDLEAFLRTDAARSLEQSGKLAGTRLLERREAEPFVRSLPDGTRIAEHDPIPFPAYPYEWPAEMLAAAGALTLELARRTLPEGFGLKDATPYNVLYRGPRPVFVDLLSFERRQREDPVWLAEAQFIRTFLLPLCAARRFNLDSGRWLAAQRDGLEPWQAYEWLGALERLGRPWLTLVSLPVWLETWRNPDDGRIYRRREVFSAAKAEFILSRLYSRLGRALTAALAQRRPRSPWSEYANDRAHYCGESLRIKEEFVLDCLEKTRPRWVLDIGSNTGQFSRMAAAAGASVVSIDADPAAAGAGWLAADKEGLDVLPLIVDIARPTAAMGWRNRECRSFLERAVGRFDMVLMLAVLHHLLVTERIPLEEILDLGHDLTRRFLVIEYIDPSDPMFRRLMRGRDALHADLSAQVFERACRRRFEILRRMPLEGGRRSLYLLRKAG